MTDGGRRSLFGFVGTSMTFRHGPRSRGAASVFARFSETSRSPRRVLYAFGLGLVLSVGGLAALAAGARGVFVPPDIGATSETPSYFSSRAERAERPEREQISIVRYDRYAAHRRHEDDDQDDDRPHHHHHATVRSSIHLANVSPTFTGSQPVCVRLCDGFFFPLPTAASDVVSQGQACNSLCPDAPTEVYYRNGAEKIEDSVSVSGKLYSALPVSLRYRSTSEETCSCHRDAVAYAPLKDTTLKHGDAIMTPAGFMVFRGVEGIPHGTRDFTALDGAGMGSGQRGALQAMERASLAPAHPTLKDWLLSQNAGPGFGPQAAAKASTQVAMRLPANARTAAATGGKIQWMTWRGRDQ
jgi:hypothetical protein